MTFKTQIAVAVDSYKTIWEGYLERIAALLDEAKEQENRIIKDVLLQEVNDQLAVYRQEYEQQSQNHNNRLKLLIENQRNSLFSDDGANRSADHQAKVANAIRFLEMEGDDLTDEIAYDILKDFKDDYSQMKIFKRMVSKHADMVDISGNSRFPKTFGGFDRLESLSNTFDELETMAKRLFISDLQEGDYPHATIYKNSYALPTLNYEERLYHTLIIKLAAEVDAYTI